MSTTSLCVSPNENCTGCQPQSHPAMVRVRVYEPTPGTYRVVVRNTDLEVGCITQTLEDVAPSELSSPSLYVIVRPYRFRPGLVPANSTAGRGSINGPVNTVELTPPPADDEDEWFLDLYEEQDGQTKRVTRTKVRLVHI